MVTKQGKCKLCNEYFKAGGEGKFNSLLFNHFSINHKEEWMRLKQLCVDAEKELYNLKEKYPELYLWFGSFSINGTKTMYDEISN